MKPVKLLFLNIFGCNKLPAAAAAATATAIATVVAVIAAGPHCCCLFASVSRIRSTIDCYFSLL